MKSFIKKILALALPIVIFGLSLMSCNSCQTKQQNQTYFGGYLVNSKDSLVILYLNDKAVDSVALDKDKTFSFSIDTDTEKLYHFAIDQEYHYVYLEPGDSLTVFANLLDFKKTMSFSGKEANVNTYITSQLEESESFREVFKKFHRMSPKDFKQKTDSVRRVKEQEYADFLKTNPTLSEKAKEITQVSTMSLVNKEIELYPFMHQRKMNECVVNKLPKDFYDYRSDIDFNNTFLAYFRPYYSYMVMFINNLSFTAYRKCSQQYDLSEDINKVPDFHINKLGIIDSVFRSGDLRDGLFRNAAYAFLFHIQDETSSRNYVNLYDGFNQESKHREELNQVFANTFALQKGNFPPDFDLITPDKKTVCFKDTPRPIINLYYLWSVNQSYQSSIIQGRIHQLMKRFPSVRFVGIDASKNEALWLKRVSEWDLKNTEQLHVTDFQDFSEKYLINDLNRCFILDEKGKIISVFENIFSANLEKILSERISAYKRNSRL
ncbi:TlpA family protein disulfide reductase [Capnocytophaga canimorsus]|uniref:TlpA family protein disulfide reductase n=1 Tax=Capnocytophaga canimorsus TaxID=28188 RepID=UPI0015625CFB|nr:DUF4369 domain-containing protein [Capnocytophaga canimorsus]